VSARVARNSRLSIFVAFLACCHLCHDQTFAIAGPLLISAPGADYRGDESQVRCWNGVVVYPNGTDRAVWTEATASAENVNKRCVVDECIRWREVDDACDDNRKDRRTQCRESVPPFIHRLFAENNPDRLLPLSIRENIDPDNTRRISALFLDCGRNIAWFSDEYVGMNPSAGCWRQSCISQCEREADIHPVDVVIKIFGHPRVHRQPGTASRPHFIQLTAHYDGLLVQCGDGGIGLPEYGYGVHMLLIAAPAHFQKHPEIDGRQHQRTQRQENCGVRGTSIVVAASPPTAGPPEQVPYQGTGLMKALVIAAVGLLCAVLMWFGAPALFIGIDQGSLPLLVGGILAMGAQATAILYTIDFCFF